MTSLRTRLSRLSLTALLLVGLALPTGAQEGALGVNEQLKLLGLLTNARVSPTGSYMAGQQALKDLRTDEAARYMAAAAQADWDNPLLVERAFIAQAADGQIAEAAKTARRLLELETGNELAQMISATEALKERRYTAAEQQFAEISVETFSGVTAAILRAWALIGLDRKDEADALLQEIGATGLDDFLIFHRALMAEAAGETKSAIRLAGQAFENEPNVARVTQVYASMLANAGQFDEAADVIAQFESQGLTHPLVTEVKQAVEEERRPGIFTANVQIGAAEMFHGLGVALARDGSPDIALVFLRLGLYLDPKADVIAVAVGEVLDRVGQAEAANRIYESIPNESPMKPAAVVRFAHNLDVLGDGEEALRRLGNIVATRPDDLDAVFTYAELLRFDEQYEKAAEAYTKALELTGGNRNGDWAIYYTRGMSYERAKQWPKAEADFKRALELNPGQPEVLNYLGYSWIDMDMNLEPALDMIEQAVEARPQDGYIIDSLGWAFYKLGRIEDAVTTLEQAVTLLPNDPELNDHLGDAYWQAGRRLEAKFQWTIAADVDEVGNVRERVAAKLANGLSQDVASQ
ncbi:tetratricopeptide repeat protein [Devosia albogilva]|uniref:Tetratricopeptide repeat protein n=1 Tax=Devosia albogilva TaxID=429726 RepID=A0ABW5QLV7_9HYPH